MCEDEKIIEKAFNVTKSCLLPKLIDSLDAKPMQYEDFDTFRLILNDNLHLLLDLLHQHEELLLKEHAFDSRLTNVICNNIGTFVFIKSNFSFSFASI